VNEILRARAHAVTEFRAAGAGPGKLGGYAAVFDQTTDLGWEGKERIGRRAFDATLKDPATDVRALHNHDPQYLLGRQKSGTLRLSVDSRGLEYEIDLPDVEYARTVRVLAERGDLDGASFAFVPGDYEWDDDHETRTHTSVARLVDVAPVTFPAYAGASTEARSLTDRHRRSNIIRVKHRAARRAGRTAL
jgi:HK97 family phage prohead protease